VNLIKPLPCGTLLDTIIFCMANEQYQIR